MRIAYFDPFSGASGDMVLGALLDAGLSLDALRRDLGRIDLGGYDLRAERLERGGISGTRLRVVVEEEGGDRTWRSIRDLLQRSALDGPVRERAVAIFARLAEAEAGVHGVPVDEVHFHEVGGVDAVVDIAGTAIGLALLGVERVFSGAPRGGSGWVRAAHGALPVPTPATAALLAAAKAPLAPEPMAEEPAGELLTPTGAAILTALAEFRQPSFVPAAVGYGFGEKELPWPNALRVWLGTAADVADDGELLLQSNIDDMNPQFFEPLLERLFAAGAVDAWLEPIVMKKGRPATIVSVLCPTSRRREVEAVFFEQSSTLGVRANRVERTKAARQVRGVATRWGDVRLKLRGWNGRVLDAMPEFDDCLALARAHDVPIRAVWNEAHRLGEVYVGQRLADDRGGGDGGSAGRRERRIAPRPVRQG